MPGDPPSQPAWSAEKVRALTLHSGDIISLLDAEGRLLFNSPASERISGFSAEELAGVDTFEFIHPDDRAEVARVFGQVVATPGGVATVEYRYRNKAGGWTWMEAVASNHLDDPEVRGVVANSRDVTERKRAEAERAALEARLVHHQRLEALGTMAGGIAHDFNNLMSALGQHLALAEEQNRDPEVGRELQGAQAALHRAAALTRQLLGFARRQPASPVTLDLGAALRRVRPLLERLLGGRVAVALEAPAAPVWVRVDPGQLEQVVVNLATNARDAMPEGGTLRVRLSAGPGGPPGGEALLAVADTGCGIPPDALPRVFEPFFTTKEVGRGTGLGLAVTHGIVTQAGGTIHLESRAGEGTTALVRLPLAPPPPAAPAAEPGAAPGPEARRARPGERLLLVDDDDMVRQATRRVLARLGWAVDEARDGAAALALAAADPRAYAAALVDLRMPGMGGRAVAARLAGLAPRLPVVLVSGFAEEAEAGAEVLQKPYDVAELARRLRAAIDGAAARPPASG